MEVGKEDEKGERYPICCFHPPGRPWCGSEPLGPAHPRCQCVTSRQVSRTCLVWFNLWRKPSTWPGPPPEAVNTTLFAGKSQASHVGCPGLPELLPAQVTTAVWMAGKHQGPIHASFLGQRTFEGDRWELCLRHIGSHSPFCSCLHDHKVDLPKHLWSPTKLPSGVEAITQDLEAIPPDSVIHGPSTRAGAPGLRNVFSGTHSHHVRNFSSQVPGATPLEQGFVQNTVTINNFQAGLH